MLIELRDVEVYVEPDDILSKALRDGDLSIYDAISICEEEADAEEILKNLDDEDIQQYCDTKGIELECNFEMMAKNLKGLSKDERASLFWFLVGINEDTQEEIKKLITVEIVLPKLNELIQVKRSINPVWDHMDDYYFCVIDDIEINIRGYSEDNKNSFHLWMYKSKNDDEVVDAMFTSYSELKDAMMKIIKGNITFPAAESLLKIARKEIKNEI